MAKRIELKGVRRLTSLAAGFRRPAFAPGGRLAIESDSKPPSLYVLDAKGRLEGRADEGGEPAWSPDGKRLAFTRAGSDGRSEIWVRDVDSPSSAGRLAGGDGSVWEHPTWTIDGSGVACASDYANPGGLRHIWVLDARHGDRKRLTCDPQRSDGHPSYAPDGQALAFDGDDRADDAREIDVYTMDLRTGALSCLTDGTVPTRRPAFIDRRWLIAERRSPSGPTLVLLDRLKKRTLPVGEQPGGEREPTVRVTKKATTIAFARRDATSGRDAVWLAELRGVKVESEAELVAAEIAHAEAAAVRAGLPVLPTPPPGAEVAVESAEDREEESATPEGGEGAAPIRESDWDDDDGEGGA